MCFNEPLRRTGPGPPPSEQAGPGRRSIAILPAGADRAMPDWLPLPILVLVAVGAGVAARLAWLWASMARGAGAAREAEAALGRLHEILRRRAAAAGGLWPETLDEFAPEDWAGLAPLAPESIHYRPGGGGRRLLMRACESRAAHRAIDFPRLVPARHALWSNGQVRLLSEEAFERLLAADNRIREEAGLDPIELDREIPA